MGRTAYEGIAGAMTTSTDHPFADILNAGRKVVFSRTLKTADWANTTIAAGDTTEEIDKLRQGGDGHIVVWGGVSLWRSLMQLDLIDELHLSLYPYVAGEGTRLFDGVPKSYRLDLVSSTASSQRDRRAAVPPAPLTQRPIEDRPDGRPNGVHNDRPHLLERGHAACIACDRPETPFANVHVHGFTLRLCSAC